MSDPSPDPKPLTVPTARERLEASRARLRDAMREGGKPAAGAASPPGWAARARALPGAALLGASLQRWWVKHPFHDALTMAGIGARSALLPLARRRPLAFVLGSAAAGALLVLVRPWRLALRPKLLIGLLPHVVATAVKQLPLASLRAAAARARRPRAP